jgi:hypothetical protein
MLETVVKLSELEIVGYSDVLPQTQLPSIVPPVFRRKSGSADEIYVPPYTIAGSYLCDAAIINLEEADSLASQREITLFSSAPIPAAEGHELWIDCNYSAHYDERLKARSALQKISEHEAQVAEEAFLARDWHTASAHGSTALCANYRNLKALALRVALYRQAGDSVGEQLFLEAMEEAEAVRELAAKFHTPKRSPMSGVALIKAA